MNVTVASAPEAAISAARPDRRERVSGLIQRHGAAAVLVLLVTAGSLLFDSFPTHQNLGNIAITSAFLAIVALGMTFVIISGGIDLSVGSVFALGGVLAAYGSRWGSVPALLLALGVCGGIGLLQGVLIARARMAPFIVTLAGLLGARGLLLSISNEGAKTYLIPHGSVLAKVGQGEFFGLGYPVYVMAGLFLAGGVVLQRTGFGQAVYAIGGAEDAAGLMGVRVARTKMIVYTASGLLAGLAGALNAARLSSGVTILGTGMELDAIAAVVIGGTLLTGGVGYLSGTVAGVLLLGVIQNIINQVGDLSSSYQQVVSGAFLAVVVVLQTYLSRLNRLR
ncbi:ABC transporter permease [Actinomadura opuntiae]|uniref:ABC transporter permease n=1 Tax=Actinomadura sp. OS1-43 TaxID=604315 RepID=UPI00255B29E8|nr:ABC transporter permease [Actinomadura sp. OS1-43]MDL4818470.1 ABC transporter permease [Actinomadura sp. OS1-43]